MSMTPSYRSVTITSTLAVLIAAVRCGRLRIVYMVDNTVDMPVLDMPVLKRADVAGWLGMTCRENTWPAVYFEPPV